MNEKHVGLKLEEVIDIAPDAQWWCGHTYCADCGAQIGRDSGPPDGWRLEDGRIVCHACCVLDTKRVVESLTIQGQS